MKKIINVLFLSVIIAILFSSISVHNKPVPYQFPKLLNFPAMPTSTENLVTNEGVELGRYLFYDPILSFDSTISCATCHQQKHAFSDSPKKLSEGFGRALQKRNTPPLFNLAWYQALFWDGRAKSIEAQVSHPIRESKEMNMNWDELIKRISRQAHYRKKFQMAFNSNIIDSSQIIKAISQFERTLLSYSSKYDKVINNEAKYNADELEGFELVNDMTKGNCLHCHTTDGDVLGTTGGFSNNGLDEIKNAETFLDAGFGKITNNKSDFGKFKIPSLRNLAFTTPYMHDGRFKSLEEVLDFYSEGLKNSPSIDSKMEFIHQGGSKLTNLEKKKIIAFLKTLNDSAFITNKNFGNPFDKN